MCKVSTCGNFPLVTQLSLRVAACEATTAGRLLRRSLARSWLLEPRRCIVARGIDNDSYSRAHVFPDAATTPVADGLPVLLLVLVVLAAALIPWYPGTRIRGTRFDEIAGVRANKILRYDNHSKGDTLPCTSCRGASYRVPGYPGMDHSGCPFPPKQCKPGNLNTVELYRFSDLVHALAPSLRPRVRLSDLYCGVCTVAAFGSRLAPKAPFILVRCTSTRPQTVARSFGASNYKNPINDVSAYIIHIE
eukprot:1915446-Rhodomonas_salina.1